MEATAAATTAATTPVPQPTITGRRLDKTATLQIMNSRSTINPTYVGQDVKLLVQGNGQFLPKGHKFEVNGEERENAFDRTIYGLKANSSILIAENKHLFQEAIGLESNGEFDAAHAKYNEFLNAIQMSFSVGEPSKRHFQAGDSVKGRVDQVINKGGASRLVINDVAYQAPINVQKTTFAVEDLIEA